MVAMRDDYTIAQRQHFFRPSRRVVGISIGDLNNSPIRWGKHGLTVAIELLVLSAVPRIWTTVFQNREGHGESLGIAVRIWVLIHDPATLIHEAIAIEGQMQLGGVLVIDIAIASGRRIGARLEHGELSLLVDDPHGENRVFDFAEF